MNDIKELLLSFPLIDKCFIVMRNNFHRDGMNVSS